MRTETASARIKGEKRKSKPGRERERKGRKKCTQKANRNKVTGKVSNYDPWNW